MRPALAAILLAVAVSSCTERQGPCAEDFGPCTAASQCGEGASCEPLTWRDGSGTICRRPCENQLDCPTFGGHAARCIDVSRDGTFRCYHECVVDEDCPGEICQSIRSPRGRTAICLPP